MGSEKEKSSFSEKFLNALILSAALNFTVFVYLPSESYIVNIDDFNFGYHMFAVGFAVFAVILSAISALIAAALPERACRAVSGVFAGGTFCVYIQYMFLNGYLPELNGEEIDWERNAGYGMATMLLLAALMGFVIYTALVKKELFGKIISKIAAALGAVQLISLAAMIFTAEGLFDTDTAYMSGKEQYTVSRNGNIIVFILDAADNSYLKTVLDETPEAFEGFEDFTVYTNTCSVFSFSDESFTQLFTGAGFESGITVTEWQKKAWNGSTAEEFYSRLHNAGYTVNGYSIDVKKPSYCYGKLDNCVKYGSGENGDYTVDNGEIFGNMCRLSFYRAFPYMLKRFTGYRNIDFSRCIVYASQTYYDNFEFRDNMDVRLSESDNKYFVSIHLDGVHQPCPDTIERTRELLDITGKYVSELKRLGVYDSSDIIITADHGTHSNDVYASTPMFMMKRKNESADKMRMSSAPIYHADFMATVLDMAGLYDTSADSEMFGYPVFRWSEGDVRERIWYEKRTDGDLGGKTLDNFYPFVFTGDTDDLERAVKDVYGIG